MTKNKSDLDREQIYQEIISSYGPVDTKADHHWGSMLAQCRPEEIFWGCMFVFQRGNINYQSFAGYLLDKMKPKVRPYYLLDLGEVLRSMIDDWNVEVPQLPRYLAKSYGLDAVLRELSIMAKESLPEESLRYRKIGTMRWWLTGK
jgi:hypothetical protein